MTNERLKSLMLTGKYYFRPKGQVIRSFDDASPINFIKTGYVKRYLITNDGTLSVQSIYGPGYLFPLTAVFIALFDRSIYRGNETYYYEGMTDVEIYSIEQKKLFDACETDPIIYKEILFQAGQRLQSNIHQIENISLKSAHRRVAHQLVYLLEQFGIQTAEGTVLQVNVTHKDIADILNLHRETVSRAMARLRKENVLSDGQAIIVKDMDVLKHFASK
jgi:CRP-like cAMP-binding protein